MKKEELFLPLNLQFFAGEDENLVNSGESQELAEPESNLESENLAENTGTTVTENSQNENSEPLEEQKQSAELNRIYANARREAEQNASKKQLEIDKTYADKFKDVTNPETGKPILSAKDYIEAVEAQKRVEAKEQVQKAGIEPSVIDQLINENPLIRQAKQAIEQMEQIEAQKQMDFDVKEIGKIDKDIKSMDDLVKLENFTDIVAKVEKGMSLVDAYKLANYDKLVTLKQKSAEQAAINQAKSKNHLQSTSGVADQSTLLEIPSNELAAWKTMYPGITPAQLKEKYNRTIKVTNYN